MGALDCNMLFKKINTILEKKINGYLQKEELTLSQWRYLHYIYERGGKEIHMKDISDYFEVSQPTATGILQRLRQKQYITYSKADYSANSKSVSLTESGSAICRAGLKEKGFVDDLLVSPLNEEERAEFQKLLEKIYDSMKES
jgi:DNA-binding MarR family transcriptional regulator